jgi:HSP20 family molecular chaperone IbpA
MANDTMDLQVQETEKQEIDDSDAERTRDCVCFVPRVDIYETNDAIFVAADMPGVDETSVDITLENDVLTINGYVQPVEPEGYHLAYTEYRVGDYERRFALSNKIDQERIEATMKDGVLRLHLPKAQPTTRTITVKGN